MGLALDSPAMEHLLATMRDEAVLTDGMLRVDTFLNHVVRPEVIADVGESVAAIARQYDPDLLLTAEASGIPPAVAAGLVLGVPVVYAKKYLGPGDRYTIGRDVASPTKGLEYRVEVARHALAPGMQVVAVDDFLAGGRTAVALVEITREAGADVAAAVFVVEKTWEPGRALVEATGCAVHALVRVDERGSIEPGTAA